MKLRVLNIAGVFILATSTMFTVGTAEANLLTYYQPPSTNSNFVSHHTTNGPVLADDFIPAHSAGLLNADWWGSSATSDNWVITIHTDNSGIPNIDSPVEGGLAQYIPVIATGFDAGGGLFRYFADLKPVELFLTAGTTYWFSVANFDDGWTWALSEGGFPFPGIYDAAQSTGSLCTNGGPHCGPWVSLTDTDFAFAIGVVPVPSAVWLFGSGLLGLAGVARRKT